GEGEFKLLVCFGIARDPRFESFGRMLFEWFRCPALEANVETAARLSIDRIRPLARHPQDRYPRGISPRRRRAVRGDRPPARAEILAHPVRLARRRARWRAAVRVPVPHGAAIGKSSSIAPTAPRTRAAFAPSNSTRCHPKLSILPCGRRGS